MFLEKVVHRGVFFLRTQWMSIFFTIYVYLTLPVGNLLAPPYNLSPILGLFPLFEKRGEEKRKNPLGVLLPREVRAALATRSPPAVKWVLSARRQVSPAESPSSKPERAIGVRMPC